jgi:hypothetical protein
VAKQLLRFNATTFSDVFVQQEKKHSSTGVPCVAAIKWCLVMPFIE